MPLIEIEPLAKVGFIKKAHGYEGDFLLEITNPNLAEYIKKGNHLMLMINERPVPFFIEKIKGKLPNNLILKLEFIDSPAEVGEYLNRELALQLDQPNEDEVGLDFEALIGFEVEDQNKQLIGEINSVTDLKEYYLLEIEGEKGKIDVPLHEDLIIGFNEETRVLTLEIAEGLLNLNS